MAFMGTEGLVFMTMVFIAVIMLAASVIVPTVGSEAQASRRMKRRIGSVLEAIDPGTASLLRDRHLQQLSPIGRSLANLPGMISFSEVIQQSGIHKQAHHIVWYSFLLLIVGAGAVFYVMANIWLALLAGGALGVIPTMYVLFKRNQRLARFEAQLPEALDMMARALQAGHPFNETLKMVSEEMSDPISEEFGRVFSDINYGLPLKTSFVSLLARIPSISLNTLVTAVLIQSESGGKIAEILGKISTVIRSRFKLQRKVRSLSAEGRLSAWILTLLPFVLAAVVSITAPTYLPKMIKDPMGVNLVLFAFASILVGIVWMRKIIRFKY